KERLPCEGDPAWSPDGTRVAYVGGSPPALSVARVDGGGAQRLAPGHPVEVPGPRSAAFRPAWSPDGTHIAYVGADGGVHVVGADGAGDRPLAPGNAPVWSPDGARIAFSSWDGEVWVA